ncbi:MAG: rod shape-determining protein MreC [Solirubrobacteraceae bacterium]
MHKQTVRRRRAVLVALVVGSLILLTAYFGEGSGGPLHAVQRGALTVLAPIQEGASRALKPVRDLFGWVGDTFEAKKERNDLRKERNDLRRQVAALQGADRENRQLRGLVKLDRASELSSYTPVTARVIGRSPTVWYATINIDKGSSAGVRVDQAVISGDGLVGRVSAVTGGAAQVTLLTDQSSGVSAKVAPLATEAAPIDQRLGMTGLVKTAVGSPSDLLLDFIPRGTKIRQGDPVVTAGSRSSRLESLFPPGIPIGVVSRVDASELDLYQRVHLRPYAQLRELDFVQVLTGGSQSAGSQVAQVP